MPPARRSSTSIVARYAFAAAMVSSALGCGIPLGQTAPEPPDNLSDEEESAFRQATLGVTDDDFDCSESGACVLIRNRCGCHDAAGGDLAVSTDRVEAIEARREQLEATVCTQEYRPCRGNGAACILGRCYITIGPISNPWMN